MELQTDIFCLDFNRTVKGVENELIMVKDAPHYGEMFDVDDIRNKVINFLKTHLNKYR